MQLSSFIKGDHTLSPKEKEIRELFTYVVVGMMTTFIGWGSFYLFDMSIASSDGFDWMMHLKTLLAWTIAVLFSYIVSRLWVYQSKKPVIRELLAFASSRLFTLFAFEFVGTQICIWIFEGLMNRDKDELFIEIGSFPIPWVMVFKVIIGTLTILGNFVLNRILVFRKKKEE